jgi:hypothetical protein
LTDIIKQPGIGEAKRSAITLAAAVLLLTFSVVTVWLTASSSDEPDIADLIPQPPLDYSQVKPPFHSDQMSWVIPLIKLNACIRATRAVRYYLRPGSGSV